jgi:hypothetical protein
MKPRRREAVTIIFWSRVALQISPLYVYGRAARRRRACGTPRLAFLRTLLLLLSSDDERDGRRAKLTESAHAHAPPAPPPPPSPHDRLQREPPAARARSTRHTQKFIHAQMAEIPPIATRAAPLNMYKYIDTQQRNHTANFFFDII